MEMIMEGKVIRMENKECPCKRKKCERYGNCDACRAYHAASKKNIPVACEKKKQSVSE